MFTGLVQGTGELVSSSHQGGGRRLRLRTGLPLGDVVHGESIAVNGVCLTVVDCRAAELSFDVSPETLRHTNLGELNTGDPVNLERAMKMSDRFGGHLVSGHVDGVGTVEQVSPSGDYTYYRIASPADILAVSIPKGSITVDGISLTLVELDEKSLTVAIIPHTAAETTIGTRKRGDRVNLEADMIGKYVARLLGPRLTESRDQVLCALLKKEGYAS